MNHIKHSAVFKFVCSLLSINLSISFFFLGGGGAEGWEGGVRQSFVRYCNVLLCYMEKVKRKESSLYIDIMLRHSMHTDSSSRCHGVVCGL